jgi:hypothetical protein
LKILSNKCRIGEVTRGGEWEPLKISSCEYVTLIPKFNPKTL